MNCGQVRTRLGDHLEGDLELSARAQVDEHLDACADCARCFRYRRASGRALDWRCRLLLALPE
jgi:predicted anti-sigma-YlaC factor YlaD